jgi:hypothetical protein
LEPQKSLVRLMKDGARQEALTMNRSTLFSSLFLAATLALGACGGPATFQMRSPRAPDADLTLKVEALEKTNESRLDLDAKNLAPPERIQAGASKYVAWYRAKKDGPWSRVATLDYDADARSAKLKDTTVPETTFTFEITAETDATPSAPSGEPVFAQAVTR